MATATSKSNGKAEKTTIAAKRLPTNARTKKATVSESNVPVTAKVAPPSKVSVLLGWTVRVVAELVVYAVYSTALWAAWNWLTPVFHSWAHLNYDRAYALMLLVMVAGAAWGRTSGWGQESRRSS